MASPSGGATKKCVLHVDEQKVSADAEIILFQESTLKMCQEAQKVHLARTRSKFKTITLPLISNEVFGYHSRRYKNFTAVSAQEKFEASQNVDEEQTQSTSSQGLAMALPTGINSYTFIIV